MKIVVMIKQVPDAEEIFIDPVKFTLNRSQARGIINPSDENALEAALRIKEAVGGEITIISMGPPQAENAIIECMGRGADRGILITDRVFAAADTYATSLTLAVMYLSSGAFFSQSGTIAERSLPHRIPPETFLLPGGSDRSTSKTLSPEEAILMADDEPAGPPPTTMASNSLIAG